MFSLAYLFKITKKKVLFFSLTIFLSIAVPLHSEEHVAPEDRVQVEKFLKHLMLEQSGMFTLIGSKPVTAFNYVPLMDENEKKALYNNQTDLFRKKIPFIKYRPTREDSRKLWDDWKKVENKYLGDNLLLIEDEQFGLGIFVNLLSTRFLLDRYYNDFAKVTGPFKPEEAAKEIGNPSKPFWEKIKKNHYLLGLLFGFGEKNAQYFQWESEVQKPFSYRYGLSTKPAHTGKTPCDLNIQDLVLPQFILYQPIDLTLQRYKQEKELCIQMYQGKDFTEFTVKLLKGIPPSKTTKKLPRETLEAIKQTSIYNSSHD